MKEKTRVKRYIILVVFCLLISQIPHIISIKMDWDNYQYFNSSEKSSAESYANLPIELCDSPPGSSSSTDLTVAQAEKIAEILNQISHSHLVWSGPKDTQFVYCGPGRKVFWPTYYTCGSISATCDGYEEIYQQLEQAVKGAIEENKQLSRTRIGTAFH